MTDKLAQDTLLDYTPSQEEEVARLKKLAAENTLRIESLMSDPVISEFQSAAKKFDKKMKEIEKLRSENNKVNEELLQINLPTVEEPTEDGYYIFTKSESRHSYQRAVRLVRSDRSLYLKAMGHWFDLSGGRSTAPGDNFSRSDTFEDLIDIDRDTIEASITKLEDVSKFPADKLGEIEGDYEKTGKEDAFGHLPDDSDEDDE